MGAAFATPHVTASPALDARREGGGHAWMAPVYVALHLIPLSVIWTGWPQYSLSLAGLLLYVRGFCITAGYHRYFSHRSYKTSRSFAFLLAVGGCCALRGGPLWWAALHRFHHRHSDGDADVVTPSKGFGWCYWGWIVSGRFDSTPYAIVRDLARYPELRLLNRFWLVPPILLGLSIHLLWGWSMFAIAFCLSTAIQFHLQALLDGLNHSHGETHYDTGDGSRNSRLLSWLAMGEGWHNNHHHFPASAKFGFRPGQSDHAWDVLRLLAKLGLVWNLRTPPTAVVHRVISHAAAAPVTFPPQTAAA
jgi:stearoyl-CoA desaturase (delta-9 desaturase)